MITPKQKKLKVKFSIGRNGHPSAKPRILVVLGPTATGKSSLAVRLAEDFRGEIISADSRQVYKGLNLGTGKITKREMSGVRHHLLDISSPAKRFSAGKFKELGQKAISNILANGKLPMVVGGTGFYISTLVDGLVLPEVKTNLKLQRRLLAKSAEALFAMLKKIDPKRARGIDKHNKARLVRAIEIAEALGRVPKIKFEIKYNPLFIGLDDTDAILKKKIKKRLIERIKNGMINEARKLHKRGLSYKRMGELGLEYGWLAKLLRDKIGRKEFEMGLEKDIWRFVKRQRTWWKKDKRINWFRPDEYARVKKAVKSFLQ